MLYEKLSGNMPRLLDCTTLVDSHDGDCNAYASRRFSNAFHDFCNLCCSHSPSRRQVSSPFLFAFDITLLLLVPLIQLMTCWIIIEILISISIDCRPSAAELLNHEFIKQTSCVPLSKLPSMLSPVTPLTDSALNSECISSMSSLTQDMSAVNLLDESWDF